LGLDYLDKRNNYINSVTLSDTKRVAAKLYQPDALTVVVVGLGAKANDAPAATGKRPERERKS
jgi:zinc protease